MCAHWWKPRQIQFGHLHHRFTYQCTVSRRTHNVHTLKKLFFNTPIWQEEKLLRRAQVQFSHTKEKAPHDYIRWRYDVIHWYTTFTLSSRTCCKLCTYKPSGFTVAAVCDVHLRPYQPCYMYICVHGSASLSTMKNKRKRNSQCTLQKACQPAKHEELALCTRENSGKLHHNIHRGLPWRILFQMWLTATSCSLWVQSTGFCQLCICFNFQLMPPMLLWYIELQTLCTNWFTVFLAAQNIPSLAGTGKSSYKWRCISQKCPNYPSHWVPCFCEPENDVNVGQVWCIIKSMVPRTCLQLLNSSQPPTTKTIASHFN